MKEILPKRTLRIGFEHVKTLADCNCPFEAVLALQGVRSPLWPTRFSVYASPVLFDSQGCLRHRRNTRYGRMVNPYPAGTFTQQEAPSCAWRTNDRHKWRQTGGASSLKTTTEPFAGLGLSKTAALFAVPCSRLFCASLFFTYYKFQSLHCRFNFTITAWWVLFNIPSGDQINKTVF